MGDIAKNVGEFAHGGYLILEWGILNVHRLGAIFNHSSLFNVSIENVLQLRLVVRSIDNVTLVDRIDVSLGS